MKNFEQELQNELVDTYLKNIEECGDSHRAFEDSEIMAAYEVAIRGLKKQIPQKIIYKTTVVNYCTSDVRINFNCPNCKRALTIVNLNYCWYCGQALDWSEVCG